MSFIPEHFFTPCKGPPDLDACVEKELGRKPSMAVDPDKHVQDSYDHLVARTHDNLWQICVDAVNRRNKKDLAVNKPQARRDAVLADHCTALRKAYCYEVAAFVKEGLRSEVTSGDGGAYDVTVSLLGLVDLQPKINPTPQHHEDAFYAAARGAGGPHDLAEWLGDHFA